MKTKIEDWDESFLDVEDYRVERALTNARAGCDSPRPPVRNRLCRRGRWQGEVPKADETAPYEKRMLENLERLNRKIAELEGQSPSSFSLNEKPKS